MDENGNARERAESLETMETEAAGTAAPEGGASTPRGLSLAEMERGTLTPEQEAAARKMAAEAIETNQPIPLGHGQGAKISRAAVLMELDFYQEQLESQLAHLRYVPSDNFDERLHPGVHERFVEWCDTSPLTHSATFHAGERKRPVWARLGEVLGVDWRTAKGYYSGMQPSEWAALKLNGQMYRFAGYDERPYYELIYGEGTFDARAEARERKEIVKKANSLLESVPIEEARWLLDFLGKLAATYEGSIIGDKRKQ